MTRERQALVGGTKESDMENGQYHGQDQEQDTDQLRLAKLGAFRIMGESITCYLKHARYFSRVLFTLGIPVLLYAIVVKILSRSLLTRDPSTSSEVNFQFNAQRRFSAPGVTGASGTEDSGELADRIIQIWIGLFFEKHFRVWLEVFKRAIPMMGLLIGTSLLNQVCLALLDSGTIYTVGLIYCRAPLLRKNSVVPFPEHVLRKAPDPRLLYRVMCTWLWAILFLMIPYIILVISQAVIVLLPLSLGVTFGLIIILLLFLLACLVGVGTLADVAENVTILDPEESYGLPAFKKARALLKGKWKVAVRLFFVWVLIFVLVDLVKPAPFTANPWSPLRILVIVMTCVVIWVLNQVRVISTGVLYLSLKVFHGESIAGPQTEETTKWVSISGTTETGTHGLVEKQAAGTDHRYSLVSV